MCGATTPRGTQHRGFLGLSPRVRGNLCNGRLTNTNLGPIPACAGQPSPTVLPVSAIRAYPRVCGATRPQGILKTKAEGLSPRVRGNRRARRMMFIASGPIPACAGQPPRAWCVPSYSRAYPRVCGATRKWACRLPCVAGLSPRVRGNRGSPELGLVCTGPIPACAGQP